MPNKQRFTSLFPMIIKNASTFFLWSLGASLLLLTPHFAVDTGRSGPQNASAAPQGPAQTCDGLEREGEDGDLFGQFLIGNSPEASGGQYVYAPISLGVGVIPDNPDSHGVDLCFTVTVAGEYRFLGRVYGQNSDEDTFFVTVDGQPDSFYLWDIPENETIWHDDYLSGRDAPNDADPVILPLTAGEHIVRVMLRETEARLDKMTLELVNPFPTATPTATEPPTQTPTASATPSIVSTHTPGATQTATATSTKNPVTTSTPTFTPTATESPQAYDLFIPYLALLLPIPTAEPDCLLTEIEPNGSSAATLGRMPICLNQTISGALSSTDVLDVHYLRLEQAESITILLDRYASNTNYNLTLFNLNGEVLETDGSLSISKKIEITLNPEDYFVTVARDQGSGPYTLQITTE